MSTATAIIASDMPGYASVEWKRSGVSQGNIDAIITHDNVERDDKSGNTFRRVAQMLIHRDVDDGIETPIKNKDSFLFPEYDGGDDIEWTLITRHASEGELWDLQVGA